MRPPSCSLLYSISASLHLPLAALRLRCRLTVRKADIIAQLTDSNQINRNKKTTTGICLSSFFWLPLLDLNQRKDINLIKYMFKRSTPYQRPYEVKHSRTQSGLKTFPRTRCFTLPPAPLLRHWRRSLPSQINSHAARRTAEVGGARPAGRKRQKEKQVL